MLVPNRPFFSIVTCTYNAGESLQDCIRSVECQSFGDYEHIIIDAFSTGPTCGILEDYCARGGPRVRLFQSPPEGVTKAMNEGIGYARGEVILHLHGDDRLAGDGVLETVHDLFRKHRPAVLVGDCRLTGHPTLSHTWPKNPIKRFITRSCMRIIMFYSNPIPHPSTYVSKAVFERNGLFDTRYRVVMDYDYWFRILRTEKFRTTNEVLSVYHFHSDTISSRQLELGLREIDGIRRKYRAVYPLAFLVGEILLRPVLRMRKKLLERRGKFHPATPAGR